MDAESWFKGWTTFLYNNNSYCRVVVLIIPNKSKLDSLKIEPQLWLYYLYEEQCNLEFDSEQLKLISESGMCFCVTCLEE
jgi:hypothetical protein